MSINSQTVPNNLKKPSIQWLGTLLVLSAMFMAQLAVADKSVYTRLTACKAMAYLSQPALECLGQSGWQVLVVDEGEREYLVLKNRDYAKSFRDEIFSEKFGHFPEIPKTNPIEWRINAQNQAHSLIVRIRAINPNKDLQHDKQPYQSRLLVIRLGQSACVAGVETDNGRARILADNATACEQALEVSDP